jgi:DNA-binding response OmpR family regulator
MDKRILIVDDHEQVGFYLKAGLIRAVNGYEVQTACSGEEALAAMAAQPFDLVISDLQMPCHRDREIEAAARRLGACGKLTKPFYRNELLAMVQMALAQPGTPE